MFRSSPLDSTIHQATSFLIARPTTAICTFLLFITCACGGKDKDGDTGHPDGIGNYCEVDEDCMTGDCYVGPGGGYCTTECDNEGSVTECPDDTVCKPIQGGARRCLLICGSESSCDDIDTCADDYCPSGSSCVDVSDSQFRACEPDPE